MTFTQWYKEAQGCEWHEDFGLLYGHAIEMMNSYEEWCEKNGKEPIWNG